MQCDEDDKEEQCDYQYYNVDIPTCRGIKRSRGDAAAALCYASAAQRYAACLKGDPIPPLITWANKEGIFDFEYWEEVTGLTGAALITYLIVSEGSRLFPPRNLIPVP